MKNTETELEGYYYKKTLRQLDAILQRSKRGATTNDEELLLHLIIYLKKINKKLKQEVVSLKEDDKNEAEKTT